MPNWPLRPATRNLRNEIAQSDTFWTRFCAVCAPPLFWPTFARFYPAFGTLGWTFFFHSTRNSRFHRAGKSQHNNQGIWEITHGGITGGISLNVDVWRDLSGSMSFESVLYIAQNTRKTFTHLEIKIKLSNRFWTIGRVGTWHTVLQMYIPRK